MGAFSANANTAGTRYAPFLREERWSFFVSGVCGMFNLESAAEAIPGW